MKNSIFILGLVLGLVACELNIVVFNSAMTDPSCLAGKRYDGLFTRAFRNDGTVDPTAKANIQAAKGVFRYLVLVLVEPCPKCSATPADQIDAIMNELSDVTFGEIGVFVRGEDKWPDDKGKACEFLKDMLQEIENTGHYPIVVSDVAEWTGVVGTDCIVYPGQRLLIWLKKDGRKSYSGFRPFGGFNSAVLKIYNGPVNECEQTFDQAWRSF